MYVNYEISFSWMLTSARFDFPKVHKRTVKRDKQGHIPLFLHSICALAVCWALHNVTQPLFSITNTQILNAGSRDQQQQCNPSPSNVFPMELSSEWNAGTLPHLPLSPSGKEKNTEKKQNELLMQRDASSFVRANFLRQRRRG